MEKDKKQTPKEKADELIGDMFSFVEIHSKDCRFEILTAKYCAIMSCKDTIKVLSSIKGMGKLHKLTFYKKVLAELEEM